MTKTGNEEGKGHDTPKPKSNNEVKKKSKNVTRAEHEALKKRALKFENENRNAILLIPCNGKDDWYEMGDNSALIYKYAVCEKLGAPVTFYDDKDSFYAQFKLGKIKARGFDAVRTKLQRTELYEKEAMKDGGMIFFLNKEFTEDEMKEFKLSEQKHQDKIKNIIKTDALYPEIHRVTMEAMKKYRKKVLKTLDKEMRDAIGVPALKNLVAISRFYYRLTVPKEETGENKAYFAKMKEFCDAVLRDLQIMSEQDSRWREPCSEVGMEVDRILEMVERHL